MESKKIIMLIVSIIVGFTMIISSAFVSMAVQSDYETYKSAVKTTLTAKSYTIEAKINVKDNDKDILIAVINTKRNLTNNTSSEKMSFTADGKTSISESYVQDDKTVTKKGDSDVYNIMNNPEKILRAKKAEKVEELESNLEKINDGERILDALIGNLQNYVISDTKSDGTKSISVSITNSQIPPIVNVLASIGLKRVSNSKEMVSKRIVKKDDKAFIIEEAGKRGIKTINESPENNMLSVLPDLTSDVSIDSVTLNATTNNKNFITKQTAQLKVSGKDAKGKVHNLTVDIDIDLSSFNSTTPDKIDLAGKKVNEIQMKEFKFGIDGKVPADVIIEKDGENAKVLKYKILKQKLENEESETASNSN